MVQEQLRLQRTRAEHAAEYKAAHSAGKSLKDHLKDKQREEQEAMCNAGDPGAEGRQQQLRDFSHFLQQTWRSKKGTVLDELAENIHSDKDKMEVFRHLSRALA
eukprot:gene49886-31810_t